ncbi:unnamed protein product [Amoebophrya sp. A120]|nr:unnamed protein product [Amoebophrya sp. A120]|eukprot:GSA120T00018738001.1
MAVCAEIPVPARHLSADSVQPKPEHCKRFQKGRCTFGDSCKFLHDPAKQAEYLASVATETFQNQCKYVIHGQRRCKNAALVSADGLCSRHSALVSSPSGPAEDVLIQHDATKRISASCKRMQNPDSVRDAPEPLVLQKSSSTPQQDVLLDIGCARGRWLLDLAEHATRDKDRVAKKNFPCFLGLELRPDLVQAANAEAVAKGYQREDAANYVSTDAALVLPSEQEQTISHSGTNLEVHFRSMNCKNPAHWDTLFEANPNTNIPFVAIQFPDPWAKARHLRRRLVDPEFAKLLLERMLRTRTPSSGSSKMDDATREFLRSPATTLTPDTAADTSTVLSEVGDDAAEQEELVAQEQRHRSRSSPSASGARKRSSNSNSWLHRRMRKAIISASPAAPENTGGEHSDRTDAADVDVQLSSEYTSSTSYLYLSTDREDLMDDMTEVFDNVLENDFQLAVAQDKADLSCSALHDKHHGFLVVKKPLQSHPLSVGTERDLVCEHLHRNVSRVLYVFSLAAV